MCRRWIMSECRKSSRLLRQLEAGNCTDFWLGSYKFIEFLRAWSWDVSDIRKRKKFSEVLGAFGPDGPGSCTPWVFPLSLEWHECKTAGLTVPKSRKITWDNTGKWRELNFIYLTVLKRILGTKCYDLRYLWNIPRDHSRLAEIDR